MPNKKIKELINLNNILPADAVAIQSGNVTHHTTVSALQSHMLKDVLKRLEALENKGGMEIVFFNFGNKPPFTMQMVLHLIISLLTTQIKLILSRIIT